MCGVSIDCISVSRWNKSDSERKCECARENPFGKSHFLGCAAASSSESRGRTRACPRRNGKAFPLFSLPGPVSTTVRVKVTEQQEKKKCITDR